MSDMKASIALRLIDEFSRPIRQLTKNFEHFTAATDRFTKLRDDAARLGQAAAGISAFGAKAQAALAGPVNLAGALESQMTAVRTLAQASVPEVERLTAAARGLGLSSQWSASQVASSQAVLAQTGWRAQEILGAMPTVMNIAASSATDLTTAARSLSGVLGGFGLQASSAERVTAMLTSAATQAKTPVLTLSNAVAALSSSASELSMSADETAALVSSAIRGMVPTDQVEVAMGTVLKTLASARVSGNAIFRSLGVSVTDTTGRARQFSDVLADIGNAVAGFSDRDRFDVLGMLFPGQARAADVVTKAAASGEMGALEGQLAGVDASQVPALPTADFKTSLAAMMASASGLAEVIGTQLLPALKWLADVATEVIRAVAGWMQEHPLLTKAIGLTLAATAGLTAAIATLLGALATAAVSMGVAGVGSAALRTKMQFLGGVLGWLRLRFVGLSTQLVSGLVPAIGRASAAVARFAWSLISRVVTATVMAVREVVRFASALVMQAARAAVSATQSMLVLAGALAGRLFPSFVAAGRVVALFTAQLVRSAAAMVGRAAVAVGTFVASLVKLGSAVLMQAIAPLTALVARLWSMAAVLVGRASAAVGAFVVRVAGMGVALLTQAVASTAAFVGSLLTMAGSLVAGAVPALLSATTAVISFGIALLATPVGWVAAAIVGLIAVGVLLWQQWDNITYLFKEAWMEVRWAFIQTGQAVMSVWSKVGDFFSELWEGIKTSFDEAIAGVMDKVRALLALIESARSKLPSWAGGTAGDESKTLYGPPVPTAAETREAARAARAAEQPSAQEQRVNGTFRLEVDDRRIRAVSMESSSGLNLELDTGLTMAGAL